MNSQDAGESAKAVLPAEAMGARPGPWSVLLKVMSAALSGGLMVLLFLAVIPAVTESADVGDALRDMRPVTIAVIVALALWIRLLLAQAYWVLTPEVTLFQSLVAREASSAVSNCIPGPSGTASQFAILHSWGVSAERFAKATVAVSVATNVLVFSAPGILFVIWVLAGRPAATGGEHSWLVGLAAAAVSALAIGVVLAIAKSERLAHAVGRTGQAMANPFRRLAGKPRIDIWPQRVVDLRTSMLIELRTSGRKLLWYTVAGYVVNGVLLVICLWACGASRSQLPLTLGLLLYSIGRISTVIQITPGGVGVVEVAYTAVYVAVLGESAHDSVVAGVLVYRMLTYLLPIVTGAIAYVVWRVMRRHEIHEEHVAAQGATGGD